MPGPRRPQYPGRVFHLRREVGGQGKAHTLNHGLAAVLADDWMQAVLIMDSDVIYEPDSLRLMTRHLADPGVGSVTAYIKEGSRPGNYLTRFIGYEYITAQAAARRSQNVLGAMACLAGGAQLHSRANIEAIGGRIDTAFPGRGHHHHVQDPAARRPGDVRAACRGVGRGAGQPSPALWKQRLRWARGNLQVTRLFCAGVVPPEAAGTGWAASSFGLFWFTLLLQPVLMIGASAALITLFFIDQSLAWHAFHALWITNVLTYVFITVFALLIDPAHRPPRVARGLLFPGVVSLIIMVAAVAPAPLRFLTYHWLSLVGATALRGYGAEIELFTYAWLAASMAIAYLAKATEVRLPRRVGR